MKMSSLFASLMMLFISLSGYAYDSNYKKEAEIPEPLLFDLVRRVNSQKGELEINSLFVNPGASEFKGLEIAPEIEYAFSDGMAVEFELPTSQGRSHSYKGALQFQLPSVIGDLTGLQLMHEKIHEKSWNESTILLLIGKRLNSKWSLFTMLGNRFVYGRDLEVKERSRDLPIANFNLFYDYGRSFDLGLEVNVRGVAASFEELIVMPQLHALLEDDFKIQFGFGASFDGYQTSPISALRLIKEFNH